MPASRPLPQPVQRTPVVLGTLKNRRVQLRLLQLVEVLNDPGELPCERAVILHRLTFVNCTQFARGGKAEGRLNREGSSSPSISSTTGGTAGAGASSLPAGADSVDPATVMFVRRIQQGPPRGPAAFLGGHLCPFYCFRGLQGLAGWFGGGALRRAAPRGGLAGHILHIHIKRCKA